MKKGILIVLAIIILIIVYRLYTNSKPTEMNNPSSAQNQSSQEQIKAVYLDVRTDAEWNEGHLDGALHWDLAKLEQGQMPDIDKNSKLLVYCRSGNRSGIAINILKNNGFNDLTNAGAFADLKK